MAKLIVITSLALGGVVLNHLKGKGTQIIGSEKLVKNSAIVLVDEKKAVVARLGAIEGLVSTTDVQYVSDALKLMPVAPSKRTLTPQQLFVQTVQNSGLKRNQIATALGISANWLYLLTEGSNVASEKNYLTKTRQLKALL